MKVFASLVFLAMIVGIVRADSFGRFGYSAVPGLPDIKVSQTGFWADYPDASHFDFVGPVKSFTAVNTHATAQVCTVDGPIESPRKIRSSLIGNSVDLYFSQGMSLVCRSVLPPFLSWTGHSVGTGVPSDDVQWAMISFSSAEPPVVFGFSGDKASLEITGSAKHWVIADTHFRGWMRVWLPLGLDPRFGTNATDLGAISLDVEKFSDVWSSPAPTVTKVSIKGDELGVDAIWSFDGTGAFLPMGCVMAHLGGSDLKIESPYRFLPGGGSQGPYAVAMGNTLSIHFPCRKLAFGRAVGLGTQSGPPLAAAPVTDVPAIVELGCECLLDRGDENFIKMVDDTTTKFLIDTPYVREPNTQQQFPFGDSGEGVELTAAHAFLSQAAMVAVGSNQPNALFDSILWKRDWWTWMIWMNDDASSRRATALAALAGAMSPDPVDRLYGATMEAGLDAERGQQIWMRRKKNSKDPVNLSEPLFCLRLGFYALQREPLPGPSFYDLIQSPVKAGVGTPLTLRKESDGVYLDWKAEAGREAVISLLNSALVASAPLQNVAKMQVKKDKQNVKFVCVPKVGGACSAKLNLPPNFPPIPPEAKPPVLQDAP